MDTTIRQAPFTADEAASFNAYQQSGAGHPFTCGSGHRTDAAHLDGEGVLVATTQGLRCPYCEYTQTWCWAWMTTWTHIQLACGVEGCSGEVSPRQ